MYYFVRVAVETLGALGDEAAQFISNLGRRIAATTAGPRSVAFLFQRHPSRQRRFRDWSMCPSCKAG